MRELFGRPLRIVVHDFAGHPFQVELSRSLAADGHRVLHLHCASDATGKGRVCREDGDPPTFDVEGLTLGRGFRKHHPVGRVTDERAYALILTRRMAAHKPDVVISSNTPLFVQARAQAFCKRRHAAFIFWQQDVLSIGIGSVVARRHRIAGAVIGQALQRLERKTLDQSDCVVPISEDFLPHLARWGIPLERVVVIPNWSPLGEVSPGRRDNAWSHRHGYTDKRIVLYCGTLGRKHDPALLWALAERAEEAGSWHVVVVAEGHGASWLRERQAATPKRALHIHDYQPYADLPNVLSSADVLLALLENDAGVFSVPSKILTYLCAGRPIVAAVPDLNLAARMVTEAGAGVIVSPGDPEGLITACEQLLLDGATARRLGENARRYAERNFEIANVKRRFAGAIRGALQRVATR